MAWLTKTEFKATYAKYNQSALDSKIDQAIAEAKDEILGEMARLYDVSGWLSAAPPVLERLAFPLAYGLMAFSVHTGRDTMPGDEVGMKLLEDVRARLRRLASGEAWLVDLSGVLVAMRTATGHVHLRTASPVFTMGAPETWSVSLPEDGDEWK